MTPDASQSQGYLGGLSGLTGMGLRGHWDRAQGLQGGALGVTEQGLSGGLEGSNSLLGWVTGETGRGLRGVWEGCQGRDPSQRPLNPSHPPLRRCPVSPETPPSYLLDCEGSQGLQGMDPRVTGSFSGVTGGLSEVTGRGPRGDWKGYQG